MSKATMILCRFFGRFFLRVFFFPFFLFFFCTTRRDLAPFFVFFRQLNSTMVENEKSIKKKRVWIKAQQKSLEERRGAAL